MFCVVLHMLDCSIIKLDLRRNSISHVMKSYFLLILSFIVSSVAFALSEEEINERISLVKSELKKGDYANVIAICETTLEELPLKSKQRISFYRKSSAAYLKLQSYNEAMNNLKLGMELSVALNDNEEIASLNNSIGVYYFKLKNYDLALEYYKKAEKYYLSQKNETKLITSYNNIGVINKEQGNNEMALTYYTKSLELVKKLFGENKKYIVGLNNIGNLYRSKKDFQKSIDVLKEALDRSIEQNHPYYEALCSHNLACTYEVMNEYDLVLKFAQRSLNISEELNTPTLILENCRVLSVAYEGLNDLKKSLSYNKRYNEYRINDLESKSGRAFAFMQTRFESAQKDREILKLENEKASDFFKKIVLWICVFFLLVIGLLIYNHQRKSIIKNKQLVDLEKKDVIRLEKELKEKSNDLTGFALRLAQRNDFIESLKKDISKTRKIASQDNVESQLKDVMLKTKQYLKYNREEEIFIQKMEDVNESFYSNLKAQYPNLTDNELRLCALLRLRLSSKEIASITNITAKSVDMNRYRLRKKIGLEQPQDLLRLIDSF